MSVYIDAKFVQLLGSRLERFKQKNSSTWTFRCPLCGDSKRNANKTRGHIYEKKDNLYFHCFNCEEGYVFGNFLRRVDPALYRDYHFEKFRGQNAPKLKDSPPVLFDGTGVALSGKKVSIDLPTIASLKFFHPAKQFILKRKIPVERHEEIFYANDFKDFVDEIMPDNEKKLMRGEKRIVIPFYDSDYVLQGFTGRAIETSSLRYIALKLYESNVKLFGLEKIRRDKPVFVVEGPFDSMFIENCIASMDSSLTSVIQHCLNCDFTFIHDNQPRNKQIVAQTLKTIELGQKVVIWPRVIKEKDINDMVLADIDVNFWIENRTFSGTRAKLELQNWKSI